MKPAFVPVTLAVSLLLAFTNRALALPPRQQSVTAVVETTDCASRTITLKSKAGGTPLTLVWSESTRFTKKGGGAGCGFDPGQTVRVSYRREVGRNVLRAVSTKDTDFGCCAKYKETYP